MSQIYKKFKIHISLLRNLFVHMIKKFFKGYQNESAPNSSILSSHNFRTSMRLIPGSSTLFIYSIVSFPISCTAYSPYILLWGKFFPIFMKIIANLLDIHNKISAISHKKPALYCFCTKQTFYELLLFTFQIRYLSAEI